ncbi:MAG: hypothetical protein RB292_02510 [Patescibacteria group bacterium]|jgi:hypothetical protein|nr:hypothetical protein [Patescibacteria group bacterium]
MPLKRTFNELANGHEELAELLRQVADAIDAPEADVCDAVATLTGDNPQNPLIGQELWKCLCDNFPIGCNPPNFLDMTNAINGRIGELQALESARPYAGGVSAYMAQLAATEAAHKCLQPAGVD